MRSNNLGVHARRSLTASQISEVSRWRPREEELSLCVARTEAIRLAKHILELDEQLMNNEKQLDELVKVSEAAPLLDEKGFGAVSAARCLTAWSHQGRVRNEAAFVSLNLGPLEMSAKHPRRVRWRAGNQILLRFTPAGIS